MRASERGTLALIEGFLKPRDSQAHGTLQSAYLICQALAQHGRYRSLHVYRDRRGPASQNEVVLPPSPPTEMKDKLSLPGSREEYAAIYVANGDQIAAAPHVLRPTCDWAPVICSVGTAHANGQWLNLFLALACGALRPTDGFIFKSRAARELFSAVFAQWSERFGFSPGFPGESTVIPNGVDVTANRRSPELRNDMRRRLRIGQEDLVFLAFSRLSPGTKGDHQALVVRWKEVVDRLPEALLVLSGAVVDRPFVAELRSLARVVGVGERVLVVDNPFELVGNPRGHLMSAADVFVHLSTGVEEASSLVVHEAMAHALPVITTSWAGMPDIITPDENGFLIETRYAPLAPAQTAALFGQADLSPHLLAASRVVSTDWPAFIAAASALGDGQRRARMAQAARQRAEAGALDRVAGAFVAFFEATAERAERAWTGPQAWRPLVDLNDVLAAQATRPLDPRQEVRLADASRAHLLCGGYNEESPEQLERVIGIFGRRQQVTVGELAESLAPGARGIGEGDPAGAARLLIRLLNFGVLELHPPDRSG